MKFSSSVEVEYCVEGPRVPEKHLDWKSLKNPGNFHRHRCDDHYNEVSPVEKELIVDNRVVRAQFQNVVVSRRLHILAFVLVFLTLSTSPLPPTLISIITIKLW